MRSFFRLTLREWLVILLLAPIWLAVGIEEYLERRRPKSDMLFIDQGTSFALVRDKATGTWACSCDEYAESQHCQHLGDLYAGNTN